MTDQPTDTELYAAENVKLREQLAVAIATNDLYRKAFREQHMASLVRSQTGYVASAKPGLSLPQPPKSRRTHVLVCDRGTNTLRWAPLRDQMAVLPPVVAPEQSSQAVGPGKGE